MLKELYIENLAIIEKVKMDFSDGLVTLSGETGAGKSIILNGINLLLGEKANVSLIRSGKDFLKAQGIFYLNQDDFTNEEIELFSIEDEEVIIERIMYTDGKSKAFINGNRVTVTALKNLMKKKVEIISQHSNQVLLNKNNHMDFLDKLLCEESIKIKTKMLCLVDRYEKYMEKSSEIKNLKEKLSGKKEVFLFRVKEIESANLKLGEDRKLEEEYKTLFNIGKIQEVINSTSYLISNSENSILSNISKVKKDFENIANISDKYGETYKEIEKLYYEADNVSTLLEEAHLDTINFDDSKIDLVVNRLDKINSLKLKYGSTIEEILLYRDELEKELKKLEKISYEEEELQDKTNTTIKTYKKLAKKFSEKRKEKSKEIEKYLEKEFSDLNMGGTKFKVNIETNEEIISKKGFDKIEFLISSNLNQKYLPLSKIASGGEINRILLALKTIFAKVDNIKTLIFDEIDTGIGGETLNKVAIKLKGLEKMLQIIIITHSPIIAASGSEQFYIEKHNDLLTTYTNVHKLSYDGRVKEISRMLSGNNVSENVVEHAKELLNKGKSL